MTTAYFLLGQIPRISWAPGDSRISPLQHSSMTSRPKWEELARDGCCESSSSVVSAEALINTLCRSSENRAYSEGRTEAGYNSLFSWREAFVWLPAGLGKSICFQMIPFLFYRRHTRLGFVSKKTTTTRRSVKHCTPHADGAWLNELGWSQ